MPTTIKDMFRWCRYYFLVHPLINSVAFKLSQYSITDLVYHTEDSCLKDQWEDCFENQLKYRSFQIEAGLDYNVYGNGIVSLHFPFVKVLRCKACQYKQHAKDAEYYFRNFQFIWRCPKCDFHGPAEAYDSHIRSVKGIRLIRWNPEDIDIRYNPITGESTYFFKMPIQIKNDIMMGKKYVVEEIPQLFIEALQKKMAIVFSKNNIFHFKRPTLAGKDRGWGIPLLLPVLKDAFYLQILKKSQEAIALEHIVPLRILFPQAADHMANPYNMVNLGNWKDGIQEEINRWRFDNNYMPIMNLPVGNQTIGGDGRALLLGQEIRVWNELIVTGMGVPQELVFGGLSFSGSNVSLRMVENMFLGYMMDHLLLLNWVKQKISSYLGWEQISMSFKPFKMADDLQRKAYHLQLNQTNKISDVTLLADADFDAEREDKLIKMETDRRADAQKKAQLAQAEIQGEAQMIMARWQMKAQGEMQPPMQPGAPEMPEEGGQAPLPQQPMPPQVTPPTGQPNFPTAPPAMSEAMSPLNEAQQVDGTVNIDLLARAQQIAAALMNMDDSSRDMALMNLRQQMPEFYQVVLGMLQSMMQGGGNGAAAKPMPEQLPPRRGPESSQI
jgi:hypothetical protein